MSRVTGTQVHEARVKAGLTIKDLANKCAMSVRTVHRIEAGERVKELHLNKVAAALRLPDGPAKVNSRPYLPTEPYRRGKPVQLRSGLELFQFLGGGWSSPEADLFFECEAPEGAAADALEELAEGVELIRQATLGPRDRLRALQRFSRGMGVLSRDGWILEGQDWGRDVFGEEYDSIVFGRVTVRAPTKARQRPTTARRENKRRKGKPSGAAPPAASQAS